MNRPPKKTETIEIRAPHETKAAFMAQCRKEELTASEVLRGLIESWMAARQAPPVVRARWRGWGQALAGLLIAVGVAANAAPVLAGSADRVGFGRWDADGSGTLSRLEVERRFARMDRDGDGVVSRGEFRRR